MLQTEYNFTLPYGYVDGAGNLHRQGNMRLATALDEIEPLRDARVRANEAYLGIMLLSRVVTRLGNLPAVTPEVVGALFSADFTYLQDLYLRINTAGESLVETECPTCGSRFTLDLTGASEHE